MCSLTLAETKTTTVPELDSAITPGSKSTTANTENALARAPRHGQNERWRKLFHNLPTELHMNIIAQMDQDPVTQVCLGLTSRYFYAVYHMVRDVFRTDGTKFYPIKWWPLDLRMQISECNQYMYRGWYNSIFHESPPSIQWGKPLGKLLEGENIWGDLKNCASCAKYKPDEAFTTSDYEKAIAAKETDWKGIVEKICEGSVGNVCRRCRAQIILIHIEKREEWRENQIVEEERTSLGLRKLDWEALIVDGDPLRAKLTLQEFLEVVGGYETWEEVFEKLGI
ncbi:uncharacterized protein LY89DRAFT_719371 [Mollisia scopiformis]|uniref:F-box domain-containing protein n=1 Tax=Mollisia scopiformis TaxID=149040 RepID=A0A194X6E9_MOLSC|nr:uncharacterized protein LY89DRAFT_719371 [Mollisia scopiformis]KUJ15644.1 hypothetical protein LY89DRAFT_719371 [Mollisia scopiformis]